MCCRAVGGVGSRHAVHVHEVGVIEWTAEDGARFQAQCSTCVWKSFEYVTRLAAEVQAEEHSKKAESLGPSLARGRRRDGRSS